MELIIIGIALLVGVAWWMYTNHEKVEEVVEEVEATVDEIEEKIEDAVEDLKEDLEEALDKLPSADELKKLTKAKLEELGREFGVELDKRKTKANMIKELDEKLSK